MHKQIVANREDLYLLATNTEKYWTLSLCYYYYLSWNFGCWYKNVDLILDLSWKSANEIIQAVKVKASNALLLSLITASI